MSDVEHVLMISMDGVFGRINKLRQIALLIIATGFWKRWRDLWPASKSHEYTYVVRSDSF